MFHFQCTPPQYSWTQPMLWEFQCFLSYSKKLFLTLEDSNCFCVEGEGGWRLKPYYFFIHFSQNMNLAIACALQMSWLLPVRDTRPACIYISCAVSLLGPLEQRHKQGDLEQQKYIASQSRSPVAWIPDISRVDQTFWGLRGRIRFLPHS